MEMKLLACLLTFDHIHFHALPALSGGDFDLLLVAELQFGAIGGLGRRHELEGARVLALVGLGELADAERAGGHQSASGGQLPLPVAGGLGEVRRRQVRHVQVVGALDVRPLGLQFAPVPEPLDLDDGVVGQRIGAHQAAQLERAARLHVERISLAAIGHFEPGEGRV